jgi:hypothetical protein
MQHLGSVTGVSTLSAVVKKTLSALAKRAYEALYEAEPNAFNVEALEALFHSDENESRWQQRKRKPSS